jgi:hypothetical protein
MKEEFRTFMIQQLAINAQQQITNLLFQQQIDVINIKLEEIHALLLKKE